MNTYFLLQMNRMSVCPEEIQSTQWLGWSALQPALLRLRVSLLMDRKNPNLLAASINAANSVTMYNYFEVRILLTNIADLAGTELELLQILSIRDETIEVLMTGQL